MQQLEQKIQQLVNAKVSSSPEIADLIGAGAPLQNMGDEILKMVPELKHSGDEVVGFSGYSFHDPLKAGWLSGRKSICNFKFKFW